MFGVNFDVFIFFCLIKVCVVLKNFRGVEFFKDMVYCCGMECNEFVVSFLIKVYFECGKIDVVSELFGKVGKRDCVIWNVMFNGYVKCGDLDSVVKGFSVMRMDEISLNVVIFDCVLLVCVFKLLIDFGV